MLRDINLSVAPGTPCGLFGPNGSGKSTLFKCINGLLQPKTGQVRVGGRNIVHFSRMALARALFQGPSILLLDEPTAHLDFKNQYRILDLVRDLTRQHHLTTLITLHDPNLAALYCSQLVMLKQGRVHCMGRTGDVFEESAIETLYDMKVSIQNSNHGQWFVTPWMDQGYRRSQPNGHPHGIR